MIKAVLFDLDNRESRLVLIGCVSIIIPFTFACGEVVAALVVVCPQSGEAWFENLGTRAKAAMATRRKDMSRMSGKWGRIRVDKSSRHVFSPSGHGCFSFDP